LLIFINRNSGVLPICSKTELTAFALRELTGWLAALMV
jgi:hypothetical protein